MFYRVRIDPSMAFIAKSSGDKCNSLSKSVVTDKNHVGTRNASTP